MKITHEERTSRIILDMTPSDEIRIYDNDQPAFSNKCGSKGPYRLRILDTNRYESLLIRNIPREVLLNLALDILRSQL